MDTEEARQRLETEQARVQTLVQGLRGDVGSQDDDGFELTDPANVASDTLEREKDLSILEQLETELAELEAALERIDNGTYGIDERTGEPIDPARLDALPTARTNVDDADPN